MNMWITEQVKQVYDNAWITVEHHDVINPSGNKGIYGRVHFKNLAIGIIPLDEELNTWIVGQHRYTLNEYSWEIPMGGSPIENDPLDSAQKELKEETGIAASDWTQILKIHTSNSVTDETGLVYVAKQLTFGRTEFDDTEDLAIRKLPFSQVFTMAMSGKITDSISLAGIFKLHHMMSIGEI